MIDYQIWAAAARRPSRGCEESIKEGDVKDKQGELMLRGERLLLRHLMNLSNTAAPSELSFRTSRLPLRLSSISSNTGLCRDSTSA